MIKYLLKFYLIILFCAQLFALGVGLKAGWDTGSIAAGLLVFLFAEFWVIGAAVPLYLVKPESVW
ncbi:hypothetical protein RP726_11795 [Candidatus Methylospira mobilis]|uniref:hypothetical protein n=1 Tax=Candidatus Methylospira mobilis TaxID=1808979 RepID=UPI0028EF599C|nr:hypothetical protein [Candidatus Methylospira mobilis]WNV03152.1 hypothetical protein RP726_11795 [Candidatus Methylospira mobilis]